MAYFRSNEPNPENDEQERVPDEDQYDDGFDALTELQEEPEPDEKTIRERRKNRLQLAFGAGNLFGTIAGALLILVLLTLMISMVHFMLNDLGRSFSLFQTNF